MNKLPIGPMSALGQKRTCAVQNAMSALPPIADMCGAPVRCPLCAKSGHYPPMEVCYICPQFAIVSQKHNEGTHATPRIHGSSCRHNRVKAEPAAGTAERADLQDWTPQISTPSNSPHLLGAFRDRLRELGYVEGQNLFIERRYAEGKEERLPQLAAELVKYGVDVIFAIGPPQALAAAKATDKIPIVFVGGGDPVALGLVKSFAHPGGNVTGITFVTVELAPKRIQLLHEAVPGSKRMGVLWNPNNVVNKLELEAATKNADTLGLTVTPFEVRAVSEFEGAFAAMEREHIDATLILSNPLTFPNRVEMTASALRHHVPTMVSLREYVEAGALMSYGPSYAGHCRRAANYVDQILKGAKPADLPVQLPTEFELTVNSKTAKALGLSIPSSIVLSANIVE